jgi:MFS transporter, DHA2 family, multidrug resistance protein
MRPLDRTSTNGVASAFDRKSAEMAASRSVAAGEEHGWRLIGVTLACLISVFLDQATGGVTQAVQSYMQGTAGASADETTWLAITYNTCYYLSLIASPWLISRFARRPVWFGGHALFAIACLGITISHSSLAGMVICRGLEGLGQGTFFVPAVMTILTVFPPALRFVGFAIFATTSLSGPAAAPTLGGAFVDANDWPMAFVALSILAVAAAVLVSVALRDAPAQRKPALDVVGVPLALVHYFTYHYVAQYGERYDWFGDSSITAMVAIFAIVTIGFFAWELRTSHPFIRVKLFAESHNLRWGAVLGLILGIPLFGGNIILQYLETQLGFTPTMAGEEQLFRIGTMVIIVPLVAYALPQRLIDPRAMIIVGFLLVASSYWLQFIGTTATADFGTFVLSFILQGAGFSLLFSPIASAILTSVPMEGLAQGIAIFKLTLTTGGSLATTMLGVVVDHRAALHQAQIADVITFANPAVRAFIRGGGRSSLRP